MGERTVGREGGFEDWDAVVNGVGWAMGHRGGCGGKHLWPA